MKKTLKNVKGLTLLELTLASGLSIFLIIVIGQLGVMTQKVLKLTNSTSNIEAYLAMEQLSRVVTRARYLTVPSSNVFKARLHHRNTQGAWSAINDKPPSDQSDDTWISAKWFPNPDNKICYFYSTGATVPADALTTDPKLTTIPVTECSFASVPTGGKILRISMTLGTDSPRAFLREILASEMTS